MCSVLEFSCESDKLRTLFSESYHFDSVLFIFEENPSSVPPFSRGKNRDSDDGIPDGIRRRTDKGYATCYGSGREKYDSSALTRRNLCFG